MTALVANLKPVCSGPRTANCTISSECIGTNVVWSKQVVYLLSGHINSAIIQLTLEFSYPFVLVLLTCIPIRVKMCESSTSNYKRFFISYNKKKFLLWLKMRVFCTNKCIKIYYFYKRKGAIICALLKLRWVLSLVLSLCYWSTGFTKVLKFVWLYGIRFIQLT